MTSKEKQIAIENLQTKIDGLTSANTNEDMLALAASANSASKNRAVYVERIADLPDIYNENTATGTLIFVKEINLHVIASKYKWITLDKRTVRNDYPPQILFKWGSNWSGQHGDGTIIAKSSPTTVVLGWHSSWTSISVGAAHTGAIKNDGTLWTWGRNNWGQLGDNTVINKSSPVSVVGGFNDWCQISMLQQSAGIRTNGTLWVWGLNQGLNISGSLGDGTNTNKSSPVSVIGGFTDWCHVSAGGFDLFSGSGGNFMFGVRSNGTLWTWGRNNVGQLGDGSSIDRTSPVSIANNIVCAWATQCDFVGRGFALTCSNTLLSWGFNLNGTLGDGTTVARASPVSVAGGFTDWKSANGGDGFTVGLRNNGTLWSWGYNRFGVLGLGDRAGAGLYAASSPVSVIGGFTDWCQVGTAKYHTVALRTNGTMWAWGGRGSVGVIGDGFAVNRSSPVNISGNLTWSCIAVGVESNAAFTNSLS